MDKGIDWEFQHVAAVGEYAERVLPAEREPVQVLGIDETYRGRRRWKQDPDTGRWGPATDPWHVGFVDVSDGQGMLGQVEGRTAKAVGEWLNEQNAAWRAAVQHVAIDMSTVFLSAVREALPDATVIVDHFHVVQLANQAVTDVRRRITFTLWGRRGRKRRPRVVHPAPATACPRTLAAAAVREAVERPGGPR